MLLEDDWRLEVPIFTPAVQQSRTFKNTKELRRDDGWTDEAQEHEAADHDHPRYRRTGSQYLRFEALAYLSHDPNTLK